MSDMAVDREVVTEEFTTAQIGEAYFDAFYSEAVFKADGTSDAYKNVGRQARAAFTGAFVKYKQRLDDDILSKTITHDNILADLTKSVEPQNYKGTVNATLNMLAMGIEGGIRDKALPVEVQKVLLRKQGKLEVSKPVERQSWLGRHWGKVAAGLGLIGVGYGDVVLTMNGNQAEADAQLARGAMSENTQSIMNSVTTSGEGVEAAAMEGSENIASQVLESGNQMTGAARRSAGRVVKTLENGIPVELLSPTDGVPGPALKLNN